MTATNDQFHDPDFAMTHLRQRLIEEDELTESQSLRYEGRYFAEGKEAGSAFETGIHSYIVTFEGDILQDGVLIS